MPIFCQRLYFVDTNILSTPNFCRHLYFFDANNCQRKYFDDAYMFIDANIYVGAEVLVDAYIY
jgi:hypothetical protein